MLKAYKFRKAPSMLIKKSLELMNRDSIHQVKSFLQTNSNSDGGFKGLDSNSDLYYTWFGLNLSRGLKVPLNPKKNWDFLEKFINEKLDLVHLTCLIRSLKMVKSTPKTILNNLYRRVDDFRVGDKGYKLQTGSPSHSVYASFLVISTLVEEQLNLSSYRFVINGLKDFQTSDGGYADTLEAQTGTTTVTSAATLLRSLFKETIDPESVQFLLEKEKGGGFLASDSALVPDLLSTASALMALKSANHNLTQMKPDIYNFLENLWQEDGGFSGTRLDSSTDCEYTYYGLICLGALS